MRILHVCLASSYTEGMTYQDNVLPAQNKKDGHDVLIISDCAKYVNGRLVETNAEDKIISDGSRLVRLKFWGKWLPKFIRNKLKITPDLMKIMDDFKPDIILYHGVIGAGLLSVGRYKKNNQGIKLYLDSHEDFNNSATNLLSKVFQYKILTRLYWILVDRYVDKVLYVSYESRDFLEEIFKMNDAQMEFYPLGGYVVNDNEKKINREKIRSNLGLNSDSIIYFHGGKLNANKKTLESLRAFSSSANANSIFLIVGIIEDDIKDEVNFLIKKDFRIRYLGWKSGEELIEILCACDCYIQPGTQSATLQVAICCGLPVIIYPYFSHEPYLQGNGYYASNQEEISQAIAKIEQKNNIDEMSLASQNIGQNLLDYKLLAKRLYH